MSDALVSEWHEFTEHELDDARRVGEPVSTHRRRAYEPIRCLELFAAGLPEQPTQSTAGWPIETWLDDWCLDDGKLIDGLLSPSEARFWFRAMTLPERLADSRESQDSVERLKRFDATTTLERQDAAVWLKSFMRAADTYYVRWPRSHLAPVARLLPQFLPAHDALHVLLDALKLSELPPFIRYFGPVAPEYQRYASAEIVRWLELQPETAVIASLVAVVSLAPSDNAVDRVIVMAREQRKSGQLEALMRVSSSPDAYAKYLLSLRRVRWDADRALECFARSGFQHFDRIAKRVATTPPTEQRQAMAVLQRIHSPKLVDGMLAMSQKGVVRTAARRWLLDEGANALSRLVQLAAGRSKDADVAMELVRAYVLDGRGDLVKAVLETMPDKVRRHVENVAEETLVALPELPSVHETGWMRALSEAATESIWMDLAARLPDITTTDGYRLSLKNQAGLLKAFAATHLEVDRATGQPRDRYDSSLRSLNEVADPHTSAKFARALFETWVRDGNPPDDRWKLFAMAFAFDDTTALFLGDVVLNYNRWMKLEDALFALDTLRVMGSELAIVEMARVTQRTRNGRLREHARLLLRALAERRGVEVDALLDRSAPVCGVGHRFEYPKATWVVEASPDARSLRVRNQSETRRKPPVDNDSSRPLEPRRQFKVFSSAMDHVVEVHAGRLESAMTLGRAWSWTTWTEVFARHPLLSHLARNVVWKACEADDLALIESFRLGEELECANAWDDSFEFPDYAWVAVAHPAEIDAHTLTMWNGIFADYELVQPFDQLDRTVYRCHELNNPGFRSPAGLTVDGLDFWNVLRARGWEVDRVAGDRVGGFYREFPAYSTRARLAVDSPFDLMSMKRAGIATRRPSLVALTFEDSHSGESIDELFVHPVVFSESHLDVQLSLN